ncbi:MAG TPA: hypothetical protein DCO72_08530 [Ruminococcus sp.]|nr:hypothetical protein [Ruminococcus sp.]
MLFAQKITIRYHKDVRYANYANQRRAVRFWKLPEQTPEENAVLFHKVFLYQIPEKENFCQTSNQSNTYDTSAFFEDGFNQTPFAPIIAVKKEGENYLVQYGGRRNRGFYHTKFIVRPNQYGRLIYNQRGTYCYTEEWYYETIIYNFVSAPYSAYRAKLFYRKEPDFLFEDLHNLHYTKERFYRVE